MTDEQIKRYIDMAIDRSINEYKRQGMLKDHDDVTYSDACEVIGDYFERGKSNPAITYAIQTQRFDPYFRIIARYFGDKATIEQIADEMGVDISTIVRNKKRLCLAIYNDL